MSQFKCPKCPGYMQTYNRAGIHIEQCGQCHGIFLDSGELEAISRAETQFVQQHHAAPPPAPGYHQQPGWGNHGYYGHHGRKKSFSSMLFSS